MVLMQVGLAELPDEVKQQFLVASKSDEQMLELVRYWASAEVANELETLVQELTQAQIEEATKAAAAAQPRAKPKSKAKNRRQGSGGQGKPKRTPPVPPAVTGDDGEA